MITCSGISSIQKPLIVGADSQIGQALIARYAALGITAMGTSRRRDSSWMHLDLETDSEYWAAPPMVDVAVMCAAITGTAACKEHAGLAHMINVKATHRLAQSFVEAGSFVVFISSNLVYDGKVPFRHASEPPNPICDYGILKAMGESCMKVFGDKVSIVRLTKVIGPRTPLLRGWIDSLMRGNVVRPFDDMVFSPLSFTFVAHALERLATRKVSGILHLSGATDISYAAAAHHIARRLGVPEKLVQPIGRRCADISDVDAPKYTSLAIGPAEQDVGIVFPHPYDTLDEIFFKERSL